MIIASDLDGVLFYPYFRLPSFLLHFLSSWPPTIPLTNLLCLMGWVGNPQLLKLLQSQRGYIISDRLETLFRGTEKWLNRIKLSLPPEQIKLRPKNVPPAEHKVKVLKELGEKTKEAIIFFEDNSKIRRSLWNLPPHIFVFGPEDLKFIEKFLNLQSP